ncbi:MAG TPA: CinA family protein [Actinomycetes bacterium]|nr:CinA family protein [Actinomycetes bacterium]
MTLDVGRVLERLLSTGSTVAVAESLTGGLVTAALTEVPGASRVVRGGVVAYVNDVKHEILGVAGEALAVDGPVSAEVATALAEGVRRRMTATFGVATTGVAGPDQQDGHPVGEVYVAVAGPDGRVVRRLDLSGAGDRAAVRRATVVAALSLLAEVVGEEPG